MDSSFLLLLVADELELASTTLVIVTSAFGSPVDFLTEFLKATVDDSFLKNSALLIPTKA